MSLRDTLVVIGLLVAFAAVTLLVGGFGAEASQTPPVGVDTIEPTDARMIEPDTGPIEVDTSLEAEIEPIEPESRNRVADGEAPTSGVIEGRVRMGTSLHGKVSHYHVRVTELANAQVAESLGKSKPFDRIWKPAFTVPERSTPRFRLEGVPFSPLGYRVEIIANGANGSSEIARVDADSPFADVSLALTAPVVYTVRLRDQHMNPHAGWDVQLRPVGDPPGRNVMRGTTDRFGVALFEDVVRGDYAVWSETREIGKVEVQSVTIPRVGQPIRVQSGTVVVPTGRDLRVEVFSVAGRGLPEVSLELYKTDTVDNRRFEAKTDFGGIYTFEHLEPGRYQLEVFGDGLQRTSRTVRIPPDGEIPTETIRLAPTR